MDWSKYLKVFCISAALSLGAQPPWAVAEAPRSNGRTPDGFQPLLTADQAARRAEVRQRTAARLAEIRAKTEELRAERDRLNTQLQEGRKAVGETLDKASLLPGKPEAIAGSEYGKLEEVQKAAYKAVLESGFAFAMPENEGSRLVTAQTSFAIQEAIERIEQMEEAIAVAKEKTEEVKKRLLETPANPTGSPNDLINAELAKTLEAEIPKTLTVSEGGAASGRLERCKGRARDLASKIGMFEGRPTPNDIGQTSPSEPAPAAGGTQHAN